MLLWLMNLGFAGGTAAVVVVPDSEGLEYTMKDNLLHYTMKDNLLHYTMKDNLIHYTAKEED